MKRICFIILCLFSLCSCNKGKLEWWEAVNTAPARAAKAEGRNDDSRFEQFLFSQMDKLEATTKPHRLDSWIDSGNPILALLNITLVVLLFGLVVLGILVRFLEDYYNWPRIVIGILTVILIVIYIPNFLYTCEGNRGNSTDIGAIVGIIGLILCVPFVVEEDDLCTNRYAPTNIVRIAYSSILPFAMLLGAFSRVIATYGSYLFLCLMLVYICSVIVTSIKAKEPLFRTLASVIYLIIITFGTVVIFYATMPAMVSILNSIILLIIAFYALAGLGSSSARASLPSETTDSEPQVDYYGPDNMQNTYKTDAAGEEIFQSKTDGRYYKHGWTGYQETDKPE